MATARDAGAPRHSAGAVVHTSETRLKCYQPKGLFEAKEPPWRLQIVARSGLRSARAQPAKVEAARTRTTGVAYRFPNRGPDRAFRTRTPAAGACGEDRLGRPDTSRGAQSIGRRSGCAVIERRELREPTFGTRGALDVSAEARLNGSARRRERGLHAGRRTGGPNPDDPDN